MKTWIYNPFEFIAGYKALIIGLAVMLLATFIGTLNGSHFDGAIDMHVGMKTPASLFYIETFISWFVTAVILYITGIILSKSSIRIVDVFGTLAFARIPLIISVFVGFFPVMQQMSALDPANPQEALQKLISILPSLILASTPLIISTIWSITLMFNAYKVSCNLNGAKLIASFIIGLIIAEILSKAAIYGVYKNLYELSIPIPGVK